MSVLTSALSPESDAFAQNAAHMERLLDRVRQIEGRTRAASERSRARMEKRGQLLPRARVALLLDPGQPFLELSSLAGYRIDTEDEEKSVAGGGLIAGIGIVCGCRVMVVANDSGIAAGALQPYGLPKILRAQEIALQNRLPYIQLVESAGANLLAYKVEDFVHGGALFRNLALISAAGQPVITVTHGSSTAGGAYQTGLSDYIVMVRGRTRAFLAGPPLLRAATGEIATEEELGGAEMHCSVSGLGDFLAEDDRHALGLARSIVTGLGWEQVDGTLADRLAADPPLYPTRDLIGVMTSDPRRPVDMREVIARIVDGSRFEEIGAGYGPATVCGTAKLAGRPLGIITNNGPLDVAGANKATHFIQLCGQAGRPLLYLNNTTGFLVGTETEQAGMIKHGSKMIQAVSSVDVPQITLFCGASFGAGNYGMCGRGFDPRFAFSWPNAQTAVMGPDQAADTMRFIAEASARRKGDEPDELALDDLRARIADHFKSQMDVLSTSARLLDDGVIDPRETRAILAEAFDIALAGDARQPRPVQFGVARP